MADEPDHLTETDLTKLAAELTTIREELEDRLFERISTVRTNLCDESPDESSRCCLSNRRCLHQGRQRN